MKLSTRQHRIVQLKLHGYTNAALARELGISVAGVKWHLKQIYQILDVHNSVELLIRYGEYRRVRGLSEIQFEFKNKKITIPLPLRATRATSQNFTIGVDSKGKKVLDTRHAPPHTGED